MHIRFKELEKIFSELTESHVQNTDSSSNTEGFWNIFADSVLRVAKTAAKIRTGISEFVRNMKKLPILFKNTKGINSFIWNIEKLNTITNFLRWKDKLSEEVENARNDNKKPTMSIFVNKLMDHPSEPSREYEAGNKLN